MSGTKREYWSKLISEQEASGQKARPFCRERGIGEYAFYKWRRRLQQSEPVQFALALGVLIVQTRVGLTS